MEQFTGRRARIAAEIRAELARQRLSRASLADAIGISENTLRRRLDGLRPFHMEEVEAIVAHLGIPLGEFLARTDVELSA